MEPVPVQMSNAARLYEARFEAVCAVFQATSNAHDLAYRRSCIELLADERCPLIYRVTLHYMMAHTSDDPVLEPKEALSWLDVLDEKVANGEFSVNAWYQNTRTFLEEILAKCEASSEEEEGEVEEASANQDQREIVEAEDTESGDKQAAGVEDTKSDGGEEKLGGSADP